LIGIKEDKQMVNECMNGIVVKSDVLHTATIRYKLMAERYLSIEEKDYLSTLKKTEFLKLVEEKGWRAYMID